MSPVLAKAPSSRIVVHPSGMLLATSGNPYTDSNNPITAFNTTDGVVLWTLRDPPEGNHCAPGPIDSISGDIFISCLIGSWTSTSVMRVSPTGSVVWRILVKNARLALIVHQTLAWVAVAVQHQL